MIHENGNRKKIATIAGLLAIGALAMAMAAGQAAAAATQQQAAGLDNGSKTTASASEKTDATADIKKMSAQKGEGTGKTATAITRTVCSW